MGESANGILLRGYRGVRQRMLIAEQAWGGVILKFVKVRDGGIA
jgi:hypothetical protein